MFWFIESEFHNYKLSKLKSIGTSGFHDSRLRNHGFSGIKCVLCVFPGYKLSKFQIFSQIDLAVFALNSNKHPNKQRVYNISKDFSPSVLVKAKFVMYQRCYCIELCSD